MTKNCSLNSYSDLLLNKIRAQTISENVNFSSIPLFLPTTYQKSYQNRELYRYYVSSHNIHILCVFQYVAYLFSLHVRPSSTSNFNCHISFLRYLHLHILALLILSSTPCHLLFTVLTIIHAFLFSNCTCISL